MSDQLKSSAAVSHSGRRRRRLVALLGGGMVCGAWWGCGDAPSPDPPPPAVDSVPPLVVPVDSPPPLTPSTWDADLGALLLLPAAPERVTGDDRPMVLSPLLPLEADGSDTTGVRDRIGATAFTLFDRRGALGDAWLDAATVAAGVDATTSCPTWPRAALRLASDSAAPLPMWLVALPAGRATAVPLDSIEALATRDSATLAAGLARLASSVAEDSGSAFRGLPMTVVRAYRSRDLAPTIVVADLVRRIPQEDQPLAEHLVLVVEQASTSASTWRVVWFERLSGREEEIAAVAPLALLRVGPTGRLSLLLGLETGAAPDVRLLERTGTRWSERWRTTEPPC